MRIVNAIGRCASHGATTLLAGGLSLRLTIGDSVPGLSAIFYATPWPVLAALAILPAFLWVRRRRWQPAGGFALVALLCGIAWARTSFRAGPVPVPGSLRVAYWNVGRPDRERPEVLAKMSEIRADVFGLGETRRGNGPVDPSWTTGQPGKHVLPLRRHMMLSSPMPATQLHDGFLNDRGQYALTQTELRGKAVFILMVDFDAVVTISRKPAFDRMAEIIDSLGDAPLIVMGDFNTPSESVYFTPLRHRLKSAFATAGRGYSHTWPMPLPVLDLDHIWVSHHFRVVSSEHPVSFLSDHLPIVADLEL